MAAIAARFTIYLSYESTMLYTFRRIYTDAFPRAIARNWRPQLVSAILVLGGVLAGYMVVGSYPKITDTLWWLQNTRQPGETKEELLAHLQTGRDSSAIEKIRFATALLKHNLQVGILAITTGVLAAIPTALLMFLNGLPLGVLAFIYHKAGLLPEMSAWVFPHGVTEIGAIMLCGGVGLKLGYAIVRPGNASRNQRVGYAVRDNYSICIGAASMFVVAAIIESYVRQSHWSMAARLVFATGTATFWALYIAYGAYLEWQQKCALELLDTTQSSTGNDSEVSG